MKKVLAIADPSRLSFVDVMTSLPIAAEVPLSQTARLSIWKQGPQPVDHLRRSNDLHMFLSDKHVLFVKSVSNPVQEKFLNDVSVLLGFAAPKSELVPKEGPEGKAIVSNTETEEDRLKKAFGEARNIGLEKCFLVTGLLQGCSGERLEAKHFESFDSGKQTQFLTQIGRAIALDIISGNYDRFGLPKTDTAKLVRKPNHGNWLFDPETGDIRLLDSAIGLNTLELKEVAQRLEILKNRERAGIFLQDVFDHLPEVARKAVGLPRETILQTLLQGVNHGLRDLASIRTKTLQRMAKASEQYEVETDSVTKSRFFQSLALIRTNFLPQNNKCVIC